MIRICIWVSGDLGLERGGFPFLNGKFEVRFFFAFSVSSLSQRSAILVRGLGHPTGLCDG